MLMFVFFLVLIIKFMLQGDEGYKLPNFIVTESGKSLLFKEWELVVDAEDEVSIKFLMSISSIF